MNIENIRSVCGVCVCVCVGSHENYTHSVPIAGIEMKEEREEKNNNRIAE